MYPQLNKCKSDPVVLSVYNPSIFLTAVRKRHHLVSVSGGDPPRIQSWYENFLRWRHRGINRCKKKPSWRVPYLTKSRNFWKVRLPHIPSSGLLLLPKKDTKSKFTIIPSLEEFYDHDEVSETACACMNSHYHKLSFYIYIYTHTHTHTHLFIWLCWVLAVACGSFSCGTWDVVPWTGIEPRPHALGARSLSHWTIREIPQTFLFSIHSSGNPFFFPKETHSFFSYRPFLPFPFPY